MDCRVDRLRRTPRSDAPPMRHREPEFLRAWRSIPLRTHDSARQILWETRKMVTELIEGIALNPDLSRSTDISRKVLGKRSCKIGVLHHWVKSIYQRILPPAQVRDC